MKHACVNIKRFLSVSIVPLFAVYFGVLGAERTVSLVRSFRDTSLSPFGDAFGAYIYGLALVSVIAGAVLLASLAVYMLVKRRAYCAHTVTLLVTVAAGVILFSGMVHTEYTVAPVQFVAYGALVLALAAKTALRNINNPERTSLRWLTLAYIVAFSMAVPVVYRAVSIPQVGMFHIVECVTSFVLVLAFTWLLYLVMSDGQTSHMLTPIIPAVSLCGNIPGIILRWSESPNLFVLIFLVLSTLLWVACVCTAAKSGKSKVKKIN